MIPEDTDRAGTPRPNSSRILHAEGHQCRGRKLEDLGSQRFQSPGEALGMLGVPLVLVRRKCTDRSNCPPSPEWDRELGAPGSRWAKMGVRGKGKASRQADGANWMN